jgi:alanine transaminase
MLNFPKKNEPRIFITNYIDLQVYQDNVYADGCKFHSFKKVMMEMGAPYTSIELASFMSTSKGYVGEWVVCVFLFSTFIHFICDVYNFYFILCRCGQRGGYTELVNIDSDVFAMLKKCISAKLCSTIMGQVIVCVCDLNNNVY